MSKIRRGRNAGRGWPVHAYLVAPVVLLIVIAAVASVYGWAQSDRDARRSAQQDASFAARLAATELANDMTSVRSSVAQVAASPSIAQAYTDPKGCQLSLALPGGADAGHLDLLRSDGTVVCSSRERKPGESGYADADWLGGALREPLFRVPVADPATGAPSVLTTVPVPGYGVM